jgi:hypothetical protein
MDAHGKGLLRGLPRVVYSIASPVAHLRVECKWDDLPRIFPSPNLRKPPLLPTPQKHSATRTQGHCAGALTVCPQRIHGDSTEILYGRSELISV